MDIVGLVDRKTGKVITENNHNEAVLRFLYGHKLGAFLLFLIFKRHFFSRLVGYYFSSRFSRYHIVKVVRKLNIDLKEAEHPDDFTSFNDFFARRLKAVNRPIDEHIDHLIMPAEGRVLALNSVENSFLIKGYNFSLTEFLQSAELAQRYEQGAMLIVRLCPADYHRFHFPCAGIISESRVIAGSLYSVHPIALAQKNNIATLNERQISFLQSPFFGQIAYVEIGATVVGKIVQTYQSQAAVAKGEEKGYFLLGGSTVVLLFEPNTICLDKDLVENTKKGFETKCLLGTCFAKRVHNVSHGEVESLG